MTAATVDLGLLYDRRRGERFIEVPAGVRPLTDQGNAERLAQFAGQQLVYVAGQGWYAWCEETSTWRYDPEDLAAVHRAVQSIRSFGDHAEDEEQEKAAKRGESESALRSAVRLSAGIPGMSAAPVDLDADPYLLNTPDRSVVVLTTGRLRPAEPADLLTKTAGVGYSPGARSPLWEETVRRMFPDPEVRSFVQRAAGYSLTGDVNEEVMFMVYGVAAAGKNTFMETIMRAMGAYATTAAPSLLTRRRGSEQIPVDVADLQGRRLVWANEASDASLLDEEKVKRIVSTGEIKARFMRRDFFSFTATHKLWLSTNHLPIIRDQDNGIWRRVLPVYFGHRLDSAGQIATEDGLVHDLKGTLQDAENLPGVMAWLVEGAAEWQRQGLNPPASVTNWRDEYRDEMDTLGQFLEEACTLLEEDRSPADGALTVAQVWDKYLAWSENDPERERLRTHSALSRALKGRGLEQARSRSARYWPRLANRG